MGISFIPIHASSHEINWSVLIFCHNICHVTCFWYVNVTSCGRTNLIYCCCCKHFESVERPSISGVKKYWSESCIEFCMCVHIQTIFFLGHPGALMNIAMNILLFDSVIFILNHGRLKVAFNQRISSIALTELWIIQHKCLLWVLRRWSCKTTISQYK